MSNYLTDIDPIGEDETQECNGCGNPENSYKGYCSKACYKNDLN